MRQGAIVEEYMPFAPIDLMMKRVEKNSDSDYALFSELLYAGEFVVKTTIAAFVAAIDDDREKHRYRLLHTLVRADGIGEWANKLEEILSGPASPSRLFSMTTAVSSLSASGMVAGNTKR